MQTYFYKARNEQGKLLTGTFVAAAEADLFAHLRRQNLYLVSHKEVAARTAGPAVKSFGKLKPKELLHFTEQLAISLSAGVSLLQGLQNLIKNEREKTVKRILENITFRVEAGSTFKDALSAHPQSFPPLYTSIVGAGESTGKMHLVMKDLAGFIEWQLDLQAKVVEASVYPAILFLTMIGVVVILMVVVIPKFAPLFNDLGVALPLPTVVVLSISAFMSKYWWLLLLIVGGVVGGFLFFISREKGRYIVDKYKLQLPLFGGLLTKIALSRFCHTFSLALGSGVDVFTALGMAAEVVGNKFLEAAIGNARKYVNTGERIAHSLQMSIKEAGSEFPDIVISMVDVGEQTGNLVSTLEKVNEYYEKEVPSTIRKIFSMFEPIMIITMGVLVGGIAMAVFLPMVQLISHVGG
jgi:type IV pilus assembly protein PilC